MGVWRVGRLTVRREVVEGGSVAKRADNITNCESRLNIDRFVEE